MKAISALKVQSFSKPLAVVAWRATKFSPPHQNLHTNGIFICSPTTISIDSKYDINIDQIMKPR